MSTQKPCNPVTLAGLSAYPKKLAQWKRYGYLPCTRCDAMVDSSGLDSLACVLCPDDQRHVRSS